MGLGTQAPLAPQPGDPWAFPGSSYKTRGANVYVSSFQKVLAEGEREDIAYSSRSLERITVSP